MTKLKNRNGRSFWKTYGPGTMFFMPFFLLFALFTIIPVFVAVGFSLTNFDMMSEPTWAGINNFSTLFLDDEIFMLGFKNTMLFAIVVGPITFCLSFIMAWIINQLKAKDIFTLAFYAPSIASLGGMASIWGYLFSSDRYGVINNLLFNLGIVDTPIMFNQDENWVMPIIIFMYIWGGMGTGFLVFLAGLQNVSSELYEAGMIDGIKNRFQELWYITVPQMKPQLYFAAINTTTAAFAVYDISVSFAGVGGANYAAHTIVIHLYDYAFTRFELGYASAISVVLVLLTYAFGEVCKKLFSSND